MAEFEKSLKAIAGLDAAASGKRDAVNEARKKKS